MRYFLFSWHAKRASVFGRDALGPEPDKGRTIPPGLQQGSHQAVFIARALFWCCRGDTSRCPVCWEHSGDRGQGMDPSLPALSPPSSRSSWSCLEAEPHHQCFGDSTRCHLALNVSSPLLPDLPRDTNSQIPLPLQHLPCIKTLHLFSFHIHPRRVHRDTPFGSFASFSPVGAVFTGTVSLDDHFQRLRR